MSITKIRKFLILVFALGAVLGLTLMGVGIKAWINYNSLAALARMGKDGLRSVVPIFSWVLIIGGLIIAAFSSIIMAAYIKANPKH